MYQTTITRQVPLLPSAEREKQKIKHNHKTTYGQNIT